MSSENTDTAEQRTIATTSLRALRAARGTAAPDVEPDVEPELDAPAADAPAESAPVLASGGPRRAADRRRPGPRTLVCAAVTVAALVFAVVSGVVWWRAGHDGAATAATTRDAVLVDARVAISTVNTSDYRKPTAALDNWLMVSAGALKSEFTDSRASAEKLLAQAKVVTSAVVLDAAVTKLDTRKGSATVIASVNVKRQPVSGAATTTRNRFRATLTEVGDDWRLSNLALVAVGLT